MVPGPDAVDHRVYPVAAARPARSVAQCSPAEARLPRLPVQASEPAQTPKVDVLFVSGMPPFGRVVKPHYVHVAPPALYQPHLVARDYVTRHALRLGN